jgi:hypothetical protein
MVFKDKCNMNLFKSFVYFTILTLLSILPLTILYGEDAAFWGEEEVDNFLSDDNVLKPIAYEATSPAKKSFKVDLTKFYEPPQEVPTHGEGICLKCDGKGRLASRLKKPQDTRFAVAKRKAGVETLAQSPDFYVPCDKCHGQKRHKRKLTLEERIALYMTIRSEYDTFHLMKRHLPVGSAYIDKEYADSLTPEEFATIAARRPAHCRKCYGFGYTPCKRCDSTGVVTVRDTKASEDDLKVVTKERCSTCDGSGGRICKTCECTGLLRVCSRCNGNGVITKPAKKNQPAYIDRCQTCKGAGRR